MPKKKKTLLKKEDCQSIAGMFADDVFAYYKAGGSLKNLAAKKVYKKLRNVKDDSEEFSVETVREEIEIFKKWVEMELPELAKKYPDDELVDVSLDITLSDDDQNYLIEKLGLPEDTDWTDEQKLAYIDEAINLKTIREGENIKYLRFTNHDSDELIDFNQFYEDEDEDDQKT